MAEQYHPYLSIKLGQEISNQSYLIEELSLALGLINEERKDLREKGAQIMMELMNCPIKHPASRELAFLEAKRNISEKEKRI